MYKAICKKQVFSSKNTKRKQWQNYPKCCRQVTPQPRSLLGVTGGANHASLLARLARHIHRLYELKWETQIHRPSNKNEILEFHSPKLKYKATALSVKQFH